jgi:hypothetical protein
VSLMTFSHFSKLIQPWQCLAWYAFSARRVTFHWLNAFRLWCRGRLRDCHYPGVATEQDGGAIWSYKEV